MPGIEAEYLYAQTIPKPGEDERYCQDAYDKSEMNSRFAIADGVTKSFLPKQWAQLLVTTFAEDTAERIDRLFETGGWREWLLPIQAQWQNQAQEIVSKLNESKHFYMRNQLATREPAASTFLGIRKKPNSMGKIWQAIVIGDSCLFHRFKDRSVNSYLLKTMSEFNSRPKAFASYEEHTLGEPEFIEIKVQNGDFMLLATDALSKWLLSLKEYYQEPYVRALDTLFHVRTGEALLKFSAAARAMEDFALESDDIGILTLKFREIVGEPETNHSTASASKSGGHIKFSPAELMHRITKAFPVAVVNSQTRDQGNWLKIEVSNIGK